jgi:hypothetical protein
VAASDSAQFIGVTLRAAAVMTPFGRVLATLAAEGAASP